MSCAVCKASAPQGKWVPVRGSHGEVLGELCSELCIYQALSGKPITLTLSSLNALVVAPFSIEGARKRCTMHTGRTVCNKPTHAEGPYCVLHGCAHCGHIILADSEDGPDLLCPSHYEAHE